MTQKTFGRRSGSNAAKGTSFSGGTLQGVALRTQKSKISHTHTQTFNGPLSGTTRVSLYQKGKTSLDFTEAKDSEWQWHQLRHMQVCTSLQTNNHASTPPLRFLQAGCPSCRPTNSVKALKGLKEPSVTDNVHKMHSV